MRIPQQVFLAVVCVLAGVAVGFYISSRVGGYSHEAYTAADLELLNNYLIVQSVNGTPAAHEAALLNYLAALKRLEAHPSVILTHQIVAVDEALTYVRLSKLAEQRSDTSAAANYLSSATALCPSLGWSHCSAEDVARLATRLDQASGLP